MMENSGKTFTEHEKSDSAQRNPNREEKQPYYQIQQMILIIKLQTILYTAHRF